MADLSTNPAPAKRPPPDPLKGFYFMAEYVVYMIEAARKTGLY
jgi:hypothetical protein